MSYAAAWILILLCLSFFIGSWRRALGGWGHWPVALLLLPYLLAAWAGGSLSLRGAACVAAMLALPTISLGFRPATAKPLDVCHVLAIAAVWIWAEAPLFGLMFDLIFGTSVQPWIVSHYPELDLAATFLPVAGAKVPVIEMTLLVLTYFLFLVRHPVDRMGFTLSLALRDVLTALTGLVIFMAVAIPLGLGIGWLEWNPQWPGWGGLFGAVVGGYLLVALVEEVYFRGLIQNLIEARLEPPDGPAWAAGRVGFFVSLGITAAVFGMAHLNNTTGTAARHLPPNWSYVLMASLAGLTYGWVWWKTRKVTASAITHAMVNLIWLLFLRASAGA